MEMLRDVFATSSVFPLCAGFVMAALVYALAPFVAITCFDDPAMVPVLRAFSFALPFFAISYLHAELSRAFKTAKYAVFVRDVVGPVLQIATFIVFHYMGLGFLSVVYSFVLSNVVSAGLMWFMVRLQIRRFASGLNVPAPACRYFPRHWRKVLVYSAPLIPLGLLFRGDHFADLIMLNILSESSDVGVYAAAVRWVAMFAMLTLPVDLMFGPLLAGQLGLKEVGHVRVLYGAVTRWTYFITLPGVIFMLIARSQMMLVFGADFAGDGSVALVILLMGTLAATLAKGAGLSLVLGGHQRSELLCLSGGLMLNVLLNVLLIPRYGIIGAAIATATAQTIANACRLLVVQFHLRIHPFTMHLAVPLLFAVPVSAVIVGLLSIFPAGAVTTIAAGCAGALVVCVAIIATGVDARDKDLLRTFLERFRCRARRHNQVERGCQDDTSL